MAKQLTIPPVISQEYEQVSVGLIKPHSRNVNQGDKGKIYQSIQDNGFYGACIVQRSTRLILAGSHRWEAAKQAGMPAVPVIWADVDDDAALRIMLSDNATARAGNDNPNALAELLAELAGTDKGLSGTGFDGDDLQDLIDTLAGMPQSGLLADADPDAIPDDAPTRVKPGQLWSMGEHRLLCGDSTKPEDVARLMDGEAPQMVWADPPYGIDVVNVKTGRGTDSAAPGFKQLGRVGARGLSPAGTYAPIIGDSTTDTAVDSFALALDAFPAAIHIWWGGNFYASALPNSPHWIIWDKQTDGNQFADAELAWTNQNGALRQFRHQWMGMLRDSERGEKRVHPTQKPVALAAWCFDKYGKPDDLIFDPFLGSGMSIIAAEQTGRKCYGMELSPEYCSIILERYERATGKQAELIEHATT